MLLVTSSRRPNNWIVPGGGVEPNEEPASTAIREVLEEAGVVGTLGRCLGMFEVMIIRNNSIANVYEKNVVHPTSTYVILSHN